MSAALASIGENLPIAEAVFRSHFESIAGTSWPLASLSFYLFDPPLVRLFGIIAGLALVGCFVRGWSVRQNPVGVFVPLLAALTAFSLLLRDLRTGSLLCGSDPALSFCLWSLLILSLLSPQRFVRFFGAGFVLLLWPFFDLSWPAAFFVAGVTALGSAFDGRKGGFVELLAVCGIAALGVLLRGRSGSELHMTFAALSVPRESSLRLLGGWFTPNFQIRRELVFAMFLVLWTGRRYSWREVAIVTATFQLAFMSEFAAPPLAVLAGLAAAGRFAFPDQLFFSSRLRGAVTTAGLIVVAGGLSLSRAEPQFFQPAAEEIAGTIQRRAGVVLHDFRSAPALLAHGVRSWVDPRLMGSEAESSGHNARAVVADYDSLTRVADNFQEILDKRDIQGILLPEDAPLINVLRELGGWKEISRSQPRPLLFRGMPRMTSLVYLVREP